VFAVLLPEEEGRRRERKEKKGKWENLKISGEKNKRQFIKLV
jgi:hypothetical protein